MKIIVFLSLIFISFISFADCSNFISKLENKKIGATCSFEIISNKIPILISLKLKNAKNDMLYVDFSKKYTWDGRPGEDLLRCKLISSTLIRYISDFVYIEEMIKDRSKFDERRILDMQSKFISEWNCVK